MTYDKEAVKSQLDLGDLMGLPAGRGTGLVRCPFHNDRNPSCSVNRTKGVFNCKGCGVKGDVFDYFGLKRFGAGYDRRAHFSEVLQLAAVESGVAPSATPQGAKRPQKPTPGAAALADLALSLIHI